MQGTSVQIQKVPFFVPLLNPLMAGFVRLGIPLGADMRLLTVRGRASGQNRTTPVAVFEHEGTRFLFGTFGDTQWVRNLRAAGEAILSRRGRQTRVLATELTIEEAAPVLRGALERYLATPMRPLLARFYAGSADGPVEDYLELARHHPVFRLREATG